MRINHNELEADFESKSTQFALLASTCKSKVWDLNKVPNCMLEIISDRLQEIDSLMDDIREIIDEKCSTPITL